MSLLSTRVNQTLESYFPFEIETLSLKIFRSASEALEEFAILVINEAFLQKNVTVDRSNPVDSRLSAERMRSFLHPSFEACITVESFQGKS